MRYILVALFASLIVGLALAQHDDHAKIQKYHERRQAGRNIAEKWSKENISALEKDDLLRSIAFEMYGVENAN